MHDNLKVTLVIGAIIVIVSGMVGLLDAYPDQEAGKPADVAQAALSTLLCATGGLGIILVAGASE